MGRRLSRIIISIKLKVPLKYRCRFCPKRKNTLADKCFSCKLEEAKKWNKPY